MLLFSLKLTNKDQKLATCHYNVFQHTPVAVQVRWLRDHEVSDTLVKELMEESTLVWSFIMEREIESPERFQAIQSYRAAMAVLRQQVHYIEQLRDSGMIDEAEEGMLLKYEPFSYLFVCLSYLITPVEHTTSEVSKLHCCACMSVVEVKFAMFAIIDATIAVL